MDQLSIRKDLRPGDLGWILYQHGVRYAADKGYDLDFEKDIAESMILFIEEFRRGHAGIWIAEQEKQIVGSIAVIPISETEAAIRWILVVPDFQGKGIGSKLMDMALNFCKCNDFSSVHCCQVASDSPGIALYESKGFRLVSECMVDQWGQSWSSRHYTLRLI